MARTYQCLRLSRDICLGLRESIRPLADTDPARRMVEFCTRLYLAHYSLESDPDLTTVDFSVDQNEIMIINNFVSSEDGDWAKDVLHQTRQVLYELTTGHEAVRLAAQEDANRLFAGLNITLDPDASETEPTEPDAPEEAVKE